MPSIWNLLPSSSSCQEYCLEQPLLYSSFPLAMYFTFTLNLWRLILWFRIKSSWWMFHVLLRRIWLLLCIVLQTPMRSSWLVLFGFPESLLNSILFLLITERWSVMLGVCSSISFQSCLCFIYSGMPCQAQTHLGFLSAKKWPLYHYVISLLISSNSPCAKGYFCWYE